MSSKVCMTNTGNNHAHYVFPAYQEDKITTWRLRMTRDFFQQLKRFECLALILFIVGAKRQDCKIQNLSLLCGEKDEHSHL